MDADELLAKIKSKPHFMVVSEGLTDLVVCSHNDQLDVEMFAQGYACGTRGGWVLVAEKEPIPCQLLPETHRHYFFEC